MHNIEILCLWHCQSVGFYLQPHTAKDFNVRGLADRIRDLEQLHYVLTQDDRKVTKEEMFNRYYTKAANPPNAQPSDGYVKAEIQVSYNISYIIYHIEYII